MIDVGAIERAVVRWLESASGCAVRVANQNAPRPAYPYVTAQLGGLVSVGTGGVRTSTDLDQEGAEVELRVRGERQLTVSVNVYAQQRPGKPYDPTQGALSIAERIRASLGLPSVLAALREAGLSFIDSTPAQDLTWLQDANFVERRQMDIRFGLASVVSERVGFIATVDVAREEGGAP